MTSMSAARYEMIHYNGTICTTSNLFISTGGSLREKVLISLFFLSMTAIPIRSSTSGLRPCAAMPEWGWAWSELGMLTLFSSYFFISWSGEKTLM